MPQATLHSVVSTVLGHQLRAVVYCRVSTREQAEEGISLEFQQHLCREAALKAGATSVETFIDEGFSGTVWERPRLQEFLSRLDEFDVLYVFRLDRLSRSIRDWANIMAALSEQGVGFVSVTEKFDFSSPFGKAMMAMLAVFAELFVDILKENVRAAFAERTRQGLHHGVVPLGYKRGPDPRSPLQPDLDAVPIITDIFSRYAAGESISDITRHLQERTGRSQYRGTTRRILSSPVYIGQVRLLGETYEGAHEPIIDADLWHDCNRRLRLNSAVPASSRKHSLAAVFRCGLCGGRVGVYGSGPAKYPVRSYCCLARVRRQVDHGPLSLTVAKADALVLAVLRDLISGGLLRDVAKARQQQARKATQDTRAHALQAEHDDLGRQIAFAYAAQAQGGLDLQTLLDVNRPLVQRKERIERELQALRSQETLPVAYTLTPRKLEELIEGADIEAQRNLLLGVFERVEIHHGHLVLVFPLPELTPLQVAVPAYYSPKRGGKLNILYL